MKTIINMEVETSSIGRMLKSIPFKERIRLVQELEKDTLGSRVDTLLARIDSRNRKNKISQKEIADEVNAVRKQIYG